MRTKVLHARYAIGTILCVLCLSECGGTGTGVEPLTATEESQTQMGLTATEDATDAINDDTANASGLFLDQDAELADITRTRTCSIASDGSATVLVSLDGTLTKDLVHKNGSVTITLTASGTETRKWTPPAGHTLSCSSTSGTVIVDWTNAALVNGLKLDVTVDKSLSRTQTVVNSGSATEGKTKTRNYTVKGTRTAVFASATASASGLVTIQKTVTSSVTRTVTFTTFKGTEKEFTVTVSTKTGAPLVVRVDRSISDGTLVKKTIVSGTLVAAASDGSVEIAFSNLIFDYSSSERCLPKSGSVTGTVYNSDGRVIATFTFTFSASSLTGVSLRLDGENRDIDDFAPEGCDLDREN